MAIRILVDSGCDITPEAAAKYNIEVLPVRISFDGEEFLDGIDMNHRQFYERLIESDVIPKTSQIPPYEYEAKFKEIKEAGDQALLICVSSKFSGCYQSANIGVNGYEDCISIVDSYSVTVGQQILAVRASELRDQGLSLAELTAEIEKAKDNIRIIGLIDTLEYLKKGGRIGKVAAAAGSLLAIKPVVTMENGELVLIGKARGSKNGNNLLNQLIKKDGQAVNFNLPFALSYSGLDQTLLDKYIADSADLYAGYEGEIPICTIGCAVGTHAGPGTIALAYFTA